MLVEEEWKTGLAHLFPARQVGELLPVHPEHRDELSRTAGQSSVHSTVSCCEPEVLLLAGGVHPLRQLGPRQDGVGQLAAVAGAVPVRHNNRLFFYLHSSLTQGKLDTFLSA